eukprot:CAMPEP_0172330170 /NCGR_PEP_ID=MMETSP1058-20130122/61262_1 /TAXON_ID=83371 /ORGANISM="Detonula confervacea, Strain CCMP 353" /LENGTH=149 /DNA_ID=CAMNT_0013047373 /DNA_START=720 /DNA_END=1169 /DNA_ORIENTATION=+
MGHEAFHDCPSLTSFLFPCIFAHLDSISYDAQTRINNLINKIPGQSRRGGDLLISFEGMAGGENWETIREKLCQICDLITYELKEATTIIELALWKAKIEEESFQSRNACRVLCGAGISLSLLFGKPRSRKKVSKAGMHAVFCVELALL